MEISSEVRERVERMGADWKKGVQREAEANLDVLNHVSPLRKPGERAARIGGSTTLYYNCQSCGALQPHSFTAAGIVPAPRYFCKPGQSDQPVGACVACGKPPHIPPSRPGLTVGTTFSPYWDISGGAKWVLPSGTRYVKGQGTYIPSKAALRDWAHANGKVVR